MNDFENNTILEHDFPDFESVELISISKKYLKIILFNTFLFSIFSAIIILIGYQYFKDYFVSYKWQLIVIFSLIIILNFVYQYFAFFQRKYAVREKDIIYQYGLLKRNIVIFPYNRIQHIALEEGWFSRMLKLKTVRVYTAGSDGADISIQGLPKQIAENFSQIIQNKIKEEDPENIFFFEKSNEEGIDTETLQEDHHKFFLDEK